MSHYLVVEHLHDGAVFSLDRALDTTSNRTVVLKRLFAERSEPTERARLRREFEILRKLEVPGVVQARALEEEGGELRLVLTDVGGDTLDARLRCGPLALPEFLDLALQLAEVLDRVHRRGVLHKDIKPRNILLDDVGRVQLIDFGIASEAPRELAVAAPPRVLEGTLAYIAPEQTGRMNRAIDCRSDLYSLGATLYEMLTRAPPFASHDPLELIHSHIARAPRPPSELDPSIPPVLSDIVLKLLAKQADDRYQSALGLRHDLQVCKDRLQAGEPLSRFPLATHDAPARFELPARLYGREDAVKELTDAYARARGGACELVVVGGPPGIGKSALVHELDREIAGRHGRLLSGKFEQLRRDQPYTAIRSALVQLVDAVLADSEEALARQRLALERSLGRLAGAMLTLLPELRPVLPRAADQGAGDGETPGAVKGRLHRAVRAFVRAFADPSAPLVLMLDDLQWADAASLELLHALLADEGTPGLLVIATVRDGAPSPALQATLAALDHVVQRIDLEPLTVADTRALVADALRRAPAEVAPLAALVHDRTGGVPLLVGEYLRDLVHHDLITFDVEHARFTWDEAAIAGAAVSADVITVMVHRTCSLGHATREALGRAACVGGEFDAALLADLSGRSEPEVATALVEAARAGLIVACGGRYRFFHDRVQQAVESLLAAEERAAIHLALGRRLRGSELIDERHPLLFEIADHFNAAAVHDVVAEERRGLVEIELAAARRSRAAGAFAAAAAYATAGAALLGPPEPGPRVSDAPSTWFSLHLLRAEGLFLSGEHDAAEAALAELLARAATPHERALTCELWAALDLHVGRLPACVDRGLAGLHALGFECPRKIGLPGVMVEFMRTRSAIAGRQPAALAELPPLRDATVRLALRLYFVAIGAAFQIDTMLMMAMTMRATRLSLQHGTSSLSAAQFLSYGLLLGLVTRDGATMEAYGRFALELLARYPDRGVEAVVKFLYGSMIQPWSQPFERVVPTLRDGVQAGLDSGQLLYAGLCATSLVSTRLMAGSPLEQVRQEIEAALEMARGSRIDSATVHLQTVAPVVGELTGVAVDHGPPASIVDATIPELSRACWGAQVHGILGRVAEGLADSDRAEPSAAKVLGQSPFYAEHVFSRALLLARRGPASGPLAGVRLRRALQAAVDKFDAWARACPANFDGRAHLLRAELHRLAGDGSAALRGYEQAIEAAVQHARPHDEALACETAARFFAAASLRDAELLYLRRARRAYLRWGAVAKVKQLEQEHPGLERRGPGDFDRVRDSSQPATRSDSGTTRAGLHLDFAGLFKATQVFADELDLDRLLAAVMRIVVEDAGADRGVLLLSRETGLVGVHAHAAADDDHERLADVPLAALTTVPATVALLAHRSGRPIVADDAAGDPRFGADAYVQRVRPRSLLAAPLVHRGERLGVLYLENNLAAGAFTPERTETLRLLAVQAAIAIDRALLFSRLEEARRAAESASEAKTRFLANMSHELRTPLNAILGYCEILSEEAEEQGASGMLEDLEKIQRAGAHLLAIVRDILDLTKIEAGRIEPAREAIELPALLADVVAVATPEVERRGNRLARAWPDDLGVILGDPTLVRQILLNLVGNAAKFTERGTITLQVERDGAAVRFTVTDTGIGMTPAELAIIFEPFVQADASPTRRFGGVGLGLTICRRLAEAMGGRLTARSERGHGSTFVLELPTSTGR